MAPLPEAVRLDINDYMLFPEDGKRHQLIDGEHLMTPSPSSRHQMVLRNLTRILDSHVMRHNLGQVLFAPLDVVLSDFDVVQPDLMFVSARRQEIITDGGLRGAPDLVVEVVSESSRKIDEVIKRKLYERFQVREYWIVDPVVDTAKVYRLDQCSFLPPVLLHAETGDELTSPLFAGLRVPLTAVFAD